MALRSCEVPEVGSTLFEDWVIDAAAEFGSNFREEFGYGWVYSKAHLHRGRKVRKDVADVYQAIWEALEQRFPTLYSSETSLKDWPQWPVEREFQQMSTTSLQHQKPVGDSLTGIYSSQSIQLMDRMCGGTGRQSSLQTEVNANPPLIIDHTYNNKHRKGGLRQEQEEYKTRGKPIVFESESTSSSSRQTSGDLLSDTWRYCAAEQRSKIFSADEKGLHHTLSFISWNAGSVRQQLDVGIFCSKSFVCGAIQEGCVEQQTQLLRCGRRVFKPDNPLNTSWVFAAEEFLESGCLLHEHLTEDSNHGWAICYSFAQLVFKAPVDWKIRKLVVGSLHVNNHVAAKADVSFKLLQGFFDAAYKFNVDIIGVDLNKCISSGSQQLSTYHKAMISLLDKLQYRQRIPIELTGTRDGDCIGFIMCPWTPLRSITFRHGTINFRALDVGIRRFDTDSHYPSFMFFTMSNQRSRKADLSDAREARKQRKKEKMKEKESHRQERG